MSQKIDVTKLIEEYQKNISLAGTNYILNHFSEAAHQTPEGAVALVKALEDMQESSGEQYSNKIPDHLYLIIKNYWSLYKEEDLELIDAFLKKCGC